MEHSKLLHSSLHIPFSLLLPSSSFQQILKRTDLSDREKEEHIFSCLSFS